MESSARRPDVTTKCSGWARRRVVCLVFSVAVGVLVGGCSSHDRPRRGPPARKGQMKVAPSPTINPALPVEKPKVIDPETEKLRSELRKTLLQDVDSLPQDEAVDTPTGTTP